MDCITKKFVITDFESKNFYGKRFTTNDLENLVSDIKDSLFFESEDEAQKRLKELKNGMYTVKEVFIVERNIKEE